MDKKKIYLSVDAWWEDRKRLLNEDLVNARGFTTDQEVIRLMQELLGKIKINTTNKKEGGVI